MFDNQHQALMAEASNLAFFTQKQEAPQYSGKKKHDGLAMFNQHQNRPPSRNNFSDKSGGPVISLSGGQPIFSIGQRRQHHHLGPTSQPFSGHPPRSPCQIW